MSIPSPQQKRSQRACLITAFKKKGVRYIQAYSIQAYSAIILMLHFLTFLMFYGEDINFLYCVNYENWALFIFKYPDVLNKLKIYFQICSQRGHIFLGDLNLYTEACKTIRSKMASDILLNKEKQAVLKSNKYTHS